MIEAPIKAAPRIPLDSLPATRTMRVERSLDAGADRAEALWRTAPWLAALSLLCAGAVCWALSGSVSAALLAGWTGLLAAAHWVVLRARRRALQHASGPIGRSSHWAAGEAAVIAGLWASLTLFAFEGQPGSMQILLAGALATVMAGAFLLAMVPIAATVWATIMAVALMRAGYAADAPSLLLLVMMLGAYLAVILIGCLTVERLLEREFEAAAEARAGRDAISLLLLEYEEQGVGWLWQADSANLLTYVSPRLCTLFGRSTKQLIGQSLPVLFGCDSALGGAMAAREPFTGLDVTVEGVDGARVITLSGTPIIDGGGRFDGYRGVGSDVTEIRRSQERLTHMASIDVLTGLPNRQRMRELFAEAIEKAQQTNTPCALLYLDLDGFKPVNDSFGHRVGDAVLRTVAERLTRVAGAHGHIGRLGGDEFAIVVRDGHSRNAVEDIGRQTIAAITEPCMIEGLEIRIGLSIGSALAPIDGNTVDDLLVKADLALYQAKSRGRGTFCHFDAKMQREAEDRLRMEQELRHAIERDEFLIYYQPVVSAETQAIVGFEALLRWKHPVRGLVPPNVFIPVLEETGLIAEVGEWVIHTACRDAMHWPDDITISVNISPRQLVIPALPNGVSEALSRTRIQPHRLELEVTESVFMSDSDGSLDVLRRVRGLGVGIALDDFGTGYSSLGYLNKTIFHTLKIDGSFVRESATRQETVSIIRAIVALANSFRMTITAEGVETPEDFQRMQELGCHKIQGYLFGRPMPHAETLPLVGTRWERKVG